MERMALTQLPYNLASVPRFHTMPRMKLLGTMFVTERRKQDFGGMSINLHTK